MFRYPYLRETSELHLQFVLFEFVATRCCCPAGIFAVKGGARDRRRLVQIGVIVPTMTVNSASTTFGDIRNMGFEWAMLPHSWQSLINDEAFRGR